MIARIRGGGPMPPAWRPPRPALTGLRRWWQARLERRRLASLGRCQAHRDRYPQPPRE